MRENQFSELIDARNQGEALVHSTDKHLKEYGDKVIPNFLAVAAYDGMDMIYTAIREQNGKVDPDKTMEIFKRYKNANSPRGPIAIDPATRDIVQNIYIRETRKVGGRNMNVEIETIPNVKDPWKEFNKP